MDDMGFDDLGLHGNPRAQTPHLDALGRASVRFSNFTVHPVCAPSRAALMTGRHFLRTGVSHVHGGKDFLHLDEVTIAQLVRRAGYATGMWGKWHLGTAPGYCPWERGFDEAYMADLYRHQATSGSFNGRPVTHDGWADAVVVDYAIDFIARHADRPWFAYVASMTPHAPHHAPPEYVARFTTQGLSEPLAKIHAMISLFDEQMGRLLAALDQHGVADDTVVLFMSDNGPAIDRCDLSDADRALRSFSGLRGWKGDIWENGVRSPLFARCGRCWAPAVRDDAVEMPDIFPTLLELAGVALPPRHAPLDGRSLGPLLTGQSGVAQATSVFNYANPGWPSGTVTYSPDGIRNEYNPVAPEDKPALRCAEQVLSIRRGPWKLLLNPQINDDPTEIQDVWLVNLDSDPGERRNLAARHADLVDELRQELAAWWAAIVCAPHAFSAPYYRLPDGAAAALVVPGKTPYRCAPSLRNTVQFLKQWHAPGQFADYHLRAAGMLCTSARFAQPLPEASRWRISAGGSTASALLPAGVRSVAFPNIMPPPDMHTLRLALDAVDQPVTPEQGAWLDSITVSAQGK